MRKTYNKTGQGLLLLLSLLFSSFIHASTLADIKARGVLRCGVSEGMPGFSYLNIDTQTWSGLDVDFCRAVAAAVLSDETAVTFLPLNAQERFEALRANKIDILARNTTWTYTRDSYPDITFIGVLYYDGQGFMAPRNALINSVKDLNEKRVCVHKNTTAAQNIESYFSRYNLAHTLITLPDQDRALEAYRSGECDVYSSDLSILAAQRLKLGAPTEHTLLPEIISKEPLSPVVRQSDGQWADIVRWVLFALINAEEFGISSNNLAAWALSQDMSIRAILGLDSLETDFPLDDAWAKRVIAAVGNYQELYDRNLGRNGLNIQRGLNALWKSGGIMYAPPMH